MRKRQKIRAALLVPSLISLLFFYFPSQAQEVISCNQYQVNGGDEAFLMNLNTPLKWGNTIYDGNIYTSPKGTVTFGQGDFTFWTYPNTPSISIAAYDYHAFANNTFWGTGNDLYVRYGSGTTYVCVDWKVMLWGQSSGEPIYIRMIAYVNPETYEWEPVYQVSNNAPAGARYGARYEPGGEVFPLNVQFVSEAPNPEPTEIPSPEPEPTTSPDSEDEEQSGIELPLEPDTEEIEPTPSPEPSPEPSESPLEPVSPQPQPVSPSPDQDRPQPTQSPDPVIEEQKPKQEKQEQKEEIELLPEEPSIDIAPIVTEELIIAEEELQEGKILLDNGVVIDENIAIALAVLDSPQELFNALFDNPELVLTALKNLGADMSPEVREQAQDVVVIAVIVAQIIGSVTMASTIAQINARSEIRRIK